MRITKKMDMAERKRKTRLTGRGCGCGLRLEVRGGGRGIYRMLQKLHSIDLRPRINKKMKQRPDPVACYRAEAFEEKKIQSFSKRKSIP